MAIALKPRQIILAALLVLTLTATAWVRQDDGTAKISLPVDKKSTRPTPAAMTEKRPPARESSMLLPLDKLQQRVAASAEEKDIFTAKSWYVPPPPPKPEKPAPPPPPQAPPLPFKFMGQFQEESGRLTVYLTSGDRTYTASEGDVINSTYRVDSVNERQLIMTYIPLSIKQTLPTGTGS